MPKSIISVGDTYGRLTVAARHGNARNGDVLWECRCACGGWSVARSWSLRSGHTTSCGCWQTQSAGQHSLKHGCCATPEYRVWRGMVARCTNQRAANYNRYGGRGVTVCDQWRTSFTEFLADVGERPGSGYTIERIDNSRGYEPGNCRWATAREQARNKRSNVFLTHAGKTQIITDWAADTCIHYETIRSRMRRGLSPEQVLSKAPSGGAPCLG